MKNTLEREDHWKAYLIGMDAANSCLNKTKKRCGSLSGINIHGLVSGYLQAIANHAPSKKEYEALIRHCKPVL
jgi:hypothetical protein